MKSKQFLIFLVLKQPFILNYGNRNYEKNILDCIMFVSLFLVRMW